MKTLSRSVANCQATENNIDLLRQEETIHVHVRHTATCSPCKNLGVLSDNQDPPHILKKGGLCVKCLVLHV